MSIRKQVLAALLAVVAVFTLVTVVVQRAIVMSSFSVLEEQLIRRDVARVSQAIRDELERLAMLGREWAHRDDIQGWLESHQKTARPSDLQAGSPGSVPCNVVALLDGQGQTLFCQTFAWGNRTPVSALRSVQETLSDRGLLPDGTSSEQSLTGLIPTETGPLLAAVAPVIRPSGGERTVARLLVGQFLDRRMVDELGERTLVNLSSLPPGDLLPFPGESSDRQSQIWTDRRIAPLDANTLAGDLLLRDVDGRPIVVLRTTLPRYVTWQGKLVTTVAASMSVCAGICALAVLWLMLNKVVIGPIRHIADHAIALRQSDDLSAQLNLSSGDEIGTLAAEFDRMVVCLRQSRDELVEMAHRAGMAEVATDVLHNVGNSLNSVGTSLDCIEDRLEQSRVFQLDRAMGLLQDHRHCLTDFLSSEGKGLKWLEYLEKLAAALQRDHGDFLEEVNTARTRLAYVRDVVSSQQAYASGPTFQQQIEPTSLVTDVLHLFQSDLDARHIVVHRDFDSVPWVACNRTRLMQVLGNLVKNAVEAMADCPEGGAELRIGVRRDTNETVALEIADTGSGIDPDVLPRLFAQGYTTKSHGHGLGLHFCANAMRRMGGSITVQSEGCGRGARFTVRIPAAEAGTFRNVAEIRG